MSKRTSKLRLSKKIKRTRAFIVIACISFLLMSPTFSMAQDNNINLGVEVLPAPSVTKNDFNFSTVNNQEGRVLGAQTEDKPQSSLLNIIKNTLIKASAKFSDLGWWFIGG